MIDDIYWRPHWSIHLSLDGGGGGGKDVKILPFLFLCVLRQGVLIVGIGETARRHLMIIR